MKETTLKKKIAIIDELSTKISKAGAVMVVDPIGLTVLKVTDLRINFHNEEISMKVIKNNILKRSLEKSNINFNDDIFKGSSALVLGSSIASMTKLIFDFAKKNEKLKIKAGFTDGKVLGVDELRILSALPNKEGMLAMLLSVLQAPVQKLAGTLLALAESK